MASSASVVPSVKQGTGRKTMAVVKTDSQGPASDVAPAADVPPRTMIHIANLEKRFKSRSGEIVNALTNINLDIRAGEFISVVGPSGCGKTTLLRILAGLETMTSGVAQCDGE